LCAKASEARAKAEDALKSGSVLVAILVGVVLDASTPFSVGAAGSMVTHGYRLPTQLRLIVLISLITYLVVAIPILSYTLRPDGTAVQVHGFSTWIREHKIQAVAAVVADSCYS
jgi:hypothetical protein